MCQYVGAECRMLGCVCARACVCVYSRTSASTCIRRKGTVCHLRWLRRKAYVRIHSTNIWKMSSSHLMHGYSNIQRTLNQCDLATAISNVLPIFQSHCDPLGHSLPFTRTTPIMKLNSISVLLISFYSSFSSQIHHLLEIIYCAFHF